MTVRSIHGIRQFIFIISFRSIGSGIDFNTFLCIDSVTHFIFLTFNKQLYHPNRDDEVISVEGREAVAHTEHGRGAEHQGRFIDKTEGLCNSLIGVCCFLDLQRTQLAVTFDNNVNLSCITITIIIEVRLFT